MTERPGGLPEDAPLPPSLDPRGRRGRTEGKRDQQRERRSANPSRRRRPGRVLRLSALVLVLLLALGGLGGALALLHYDRQIDRVDVPALQAADDVDGGDTNYLLVGSDSRDGLTADELAQVRTTAKDGAGTLTDTIILVHVPGGGGAPVLVSFPRDAFVEIPGSGKGRINTAYALGERAADGGGPDRLVATVQALSGLQIDHYLEVGFISFLRLTDALGGVDVDLCQAVADKDSGIDLPAGQQTLDGGDALAFVRQRQGLPRGDLDRIQRQQYFLGSVAREVLSPSTVLRPDRLLRVAGAVTSSITADEELSTFDLARLGLRLRGAASGGLAFQTVPVADADARIGGASVVLLDEQALPGFFAGLSPSEPVEPPPTVQIPPSSIRLAVMNGTARGGLAGDAAEQLTAQGYTVSRTGNADATSSTTVVLHGSGRADSAATVAASVPGAELRQDDSVGENGLVLVLGEDFSTVRPVTVGAAPAPAPEAPAEGAPAAEAPPAEQGRPCIN